MAEDSSLRKRKRRTIYHFRTDSEYQEGSGRPPDSKELWNGFKGFSTTHGVPHITKARGPLKKIFWSVCLLGCLVAFFYNLVYLFILYSNFLVTVRVQLLHNREMSFPAVTICNTNPVKSSAVFTSPRLVALLESWGIELDGDGSRKKRHTGPKESPTSVREDSPDKPRHRKKRFVSDSSCSDIRSVTIEQRAISGHNDIVHEGVASGEDCYNLCSSQAGCESADYDVRGVPGQTCNLAFADQYSADLISAGVSNWDYYENCEGCALGHPEPADTTRYCYSTFPDWYATYACDDGKFWSSDGLKNKTITCSCQTENWEAISDFCEAKADCSLAAPDVSAYDIITINTPGQEHGDVAYYECIPGLELIDGDSQAMCNDGNWEFVPTGILGYCDYGFTIYTTPKTYAQAVFDCKARGKQIVIIDSQAKLRQIQELLRCRYQMAWIGLTYNSKDELWTWDNGDPLIFSNWLPGNPESRNKKEDCVRIVNSAGSWSNRKCNRKYAYICEGGTSPCLPNPCLNDGICCAVNEKSQCLCPKPFSGDRCETGKKFKAGRGRHHVRSSNITQTTKNVSGKTTSSALSTNTSSTPLVLNSTIAPGNQDNTSSTSTPAMPGPATMMANTTHARPKTATPSPMTGTTLGRLNNPTPRSTSRDVKNDTMTSKSKETEKFTSITPIFYTKASIKNQSHINSSPNAKITTESWTQRPTTLTTANGKNIQTNALMVNGNTTANPTKGTVANSTEYPSGSANSTNNSEELHGSATKIPSTGEDIESTTTNFNSSAMENQDTTTTMDWYRLFNAGVNNNATDAHTPNHQQQNEPGNMPRTPSAATGSTRTDSEPEVITSDSNSSLIDGTQSQMMKILTTFAPYNLTTDNTDEEASNITLVDVKPADSAAGMTTISDQIASNQNVLSKQSNVTAPLEATTTSTTEPTTTTTEPTTTEEPTTTTQEPTTTSTSTSTQTDPPTTAPSSRFPERNENPLREDFKKEEDLMKVLADLDEETKKELGYTFDDMIIDCQYEGRNCEESDFDWFFDAVHGNCYVFNSGWMWPEGKEHFYSHRVGRRYGLKAIINIGQHEYLQGVGESAGAVVVVHPVDRMPFPEDEGVLAVPGRGTAIGVKKLEVIRKPEPYGECLDSTESNLTRNVFEEKYPTRYSSNACFKTCYQRHVIVQCGCADPQYPMTGQAFDNAQVEACDIRNIEQDDCKYEITQKYIKDELDCDCPNPCHDVAFLYSVSSNMWPADIQQESVIESLGSSMDELKALNDSSVFRRNLLKIEVYFEEFNYEKIEEFPKYPLTKLFSDIGGILGLWIGCSVLSIAEFMELGLDFLVLAVYRVGKKKYWASSDGKVATPKNKTRSISSATSGNVLGGLNETSLNSDRSVSNSGGNPQPGQVTKYGGFMARKNSIRNMGSRQGGERGSGAMAGSVNTGFQLPGIILEDLSERDVANTGSGNPPQKYTYYDDKKRKEKTHQSYLSRMSNLARRPLSSVNKKTKKDKKEKSPSPPHANREELPNIEGGLRLTLGSMYNDSENDKDTNLVRRRGQFNEENPPFKFI